MKVPILTLFVCCIDFIVCSTDFSDTEPTVLDSLNETTGIYDSTEDETQTCDNVTCSTSGLNNSDYNSSTSVAPETTIASLEYDKPESSTQSGKNKEENGKGLPDSTLTTTEATTSTSTITTTTTTPPVTELPSSSRHPDQVCSCDMKASECDINCCCDSDCTALDKNVFSHCLSDKDNFPEDPNHCFKTNFIYRNNTPLTIFKHHTKGLFCIAKDNLPERYQYIDLSPINTSKQFHKLLKRRRKKLFSWPSNFKSIKPDAFPSNSNYKTGSKIWISDNSSNMRPFTLQKSAGFLLCDGEADMQYLHDWKSKCLRNAPFNYSDCESHSSFLDMTSFYENITLVPNPSAMNSSQLECSDEFCLRFDALVCDENMNQCVNDIRKPKFDVNSNTCMNVVEKALYIIHHNGTQGIILAEVHFHLINISVSKESLFRQATEINFRWVSNNDTSSILKRSGKPGYLEGKPIISAQKVTETVDSQDEKLMALSNNPQNWLTIAAAGYDGECISSRLNVNFRQNMHSECKLIVPCDCAAARNKSWYAILGMYSENVTNIHKINLHISSYGDPNATNLNSWVPVVVETQSNPNRHKFACQNIYSAVSFRIIYSKFGTFKRPQSKIIGIFINIFESDKSIIEVKDQIDVIRIISSISFVDASKTAITRFADPPVYEIKLPTDFFYPFLSSGHRQCPSISVILVLFTILIYSNI
ncbi:tectonic-1 isoform X1 [Nilaparvata lugens]|uniref:tectonic-1 isoform X1 n=1 Tax=Nilaparvata lugens TaxID=108931 RepID=UPI00193DA456|nr:tectonic-1 isoform X1 [Nilaparvata lugens]